LENRAVHLGLTSFKEDSATRDRVMSMYKAYQSRGQFNFMFFNWSEKLSIIYTTSAMETHALGWAVGMVLAQLDKSYTSTQNIHIIGHSLGAHIAGRAGHTFLNLTYKRLARITGLDPALPCFEKDSWLAGISSNDAKFVDVIHSNIGVFGQIGPLGDVDFYSNG
jgi:pimeloyl-ACP methyl ester carboxylesterase